MNNPIEDIRTVWDKAWDSFNNFHNTLITLASGTIVLTVSLIGFRSASADLNPLKYSWALFIATIICSLIRNFTHSHYLETKATLEIYQAVDRAMGNKNHERPNLNRMLATWYIISKIFHFCSPIAFIFGMIFITKYGFSILR